MCIRERQLCKNKTVPVKKRFSAPGFHPISVTKGKVFSLRSQSSNKNHGGSRVYENHVVKTWEQRGEIRKKPYKRTIKPIFGPDTGGGGIQEFNLNVTSINPHSGTEYHNHVIGEAIYVVSGSGELMLGQERYQLKAGIAIYAPKGVFHQVINRTAQTLKLVNVFAPGMNREELKKRTVLRQPPKTK